MHKSKWSQVVYERNLSENFRATSLDSLANSSNQSESLSDESHDSDSGTDIKSKNSFTVKCEVYSQKPCGSIRSWAKSESSCSSDSYQDNVQVEEKRNGEKRSDSALARMETIPEENEPKVSVKAILARFENLKSDKDCNNNNNNYSQVNKVSKVREVGGSVASACSSASSKSSTKSSKSNDDGKEEKKVKKEVKAPKEVK